MAGASMYFLGLDINFAGNQVPPLFTPFVVWCFQFWKLVGDFSLGVVENTGQSRSH